MKLNENWDKELLHKSDMTANQENIFIFIFTSHTRPHTNKSQQQACPTMFSTVVSSENIPVVFFCICSAFPVMCCVVCICSAFLQRVS